MEFSPVVSHLLTFLLGSLTGAAGKYMADRFTDQRRRKEDRCTERSQLGALERTMPELLSEMRADLREGGAVREFVILSNPHVQYTHDRARLVFYESSLPDIRNYAAALCEVGYAEEITTSATPKFRLREHFVSLLLDQQESSGAYGRK